jgi:hypothetical protein
MLRTGSAIIDRRYMMGFDTAPSVQVFSTHWPKGDSLDLLIGMKIPSPLRLS